MLRFCNAVAQKRRSAVPVPRPLSRAACKTGGPEGAGRQAVLRGVSTASCKVAVNSPMNSTVEPRDPVTIRLRRSPQAAAIRASELPTKGGQPQETQERGVNFLALKRLSWTAPPCPACLSELRVSLNSTAQPKQLPRRPMRYAVMLHPEAFCTRKKEAAWKAQDSGNLSLLDRTWQRDLATEGCVQEVRTNSVKSCALPVWWRAMGEPVRN